LQCACYNHQYACEKEMQVCESAYRFIDAQQATTTMEVGLYVKLCA
jgi:hypothetical protein